ncbi:Regulatory protein BlaR1 [Pirellulimonas nuda]|uniref:Regulatory protein BlaR1 n=1 Tax=Pirellulimonas nuda TaxID=2528009 RepID=A0A518D711_9BACT|nr:M56 family metallopeptidase [Pirellulimonas nuda]QDU87270.1 Regulatory protein BlaR1 [Pirellulimonas nuda]
MNPLWTAVGWTMLHFLWVGAAILLAAAVLRTALRRAPARVRYAASLLTLAWLATAPVLCGTLLVEKPADPSRPVGWVTRASGNPSSSAEEAAVPSVDAQVNTASVALEAVEAFEPSPPRDGLPLARITHPTRALQVAAEAAPYVWLVGAPLTLLLLATGVIGAERLKHAGAAIDDPATLALLARARRTMRVGRRVALLACDRVAQPVLIGVLRPAILLPPALLAGLSTDELELVLLHELAHVRRWDNLVNLLQRVIEALLFFHPAVWIASRWVRRDREECCDALVVDATGRRQAYAGLLVRVAQSVLEGRPAPALATTNGPTPARPPGAADPEPGGRRDARFTQAVAGGVAGGGGDAWRGGALGDGRGNREAEAPGGRREACGGEAGNRGLA